VRGRKKRKRKKVVRGKERGRKDSVCPNVVPFFIAIDTTGHTGGGEKTVKEGGGGREKTRTSHNLVADKETKGKGGRNATAVSRRVP